MPAGYRIALARPDHAGAVYRTMRDAFAQHAGKLDPPTGALRETVEDVARALQEGGAVIAWRDEDAVGSARFSLESGYLYVGRVAVVPTHRGKGIASAMMQALEEIATLLDRSEIRLATRESLPGNITIYKKLGYDVVEVVPHPRGSDRVVTLTKRLPG